MKKYAVPQNRKLQQRGLLAFKNEAQKVQFDFAPWETENGTITSVTWTVETGQATVTSESLASSKASAIISTPEYGRSSITIKATSDTGLVMVTTLNVTAKDMASCGYNDYSSYH